MANWSLRVFQRAKESVDLDIRKHRMTNQTGCVSKKLPIGKIRRDWAQKRICLWMYDDRFGDTRIFPFLF